MSPKIRSSYFQLRPGLPLPDIGGLAPFRAVVIPDIEVPAPWQAEVSAWLVQGGCNYVLAWGERGSSWDDSVDYANLEMYDYGEIPDDELVMTTWHEKETIEEVFWQAKNLNMGGSPPANALIVHIALEPRRKDILSLFKKA